MALIGIKKIPENDPRGRPRQARHRQVSTFSMPNCAAATDRSRATTAYGRTEKRYRKRRAIFRSFRRQALVRRRLNIVDRASMQVISYRLSTKRQAVLEHFRFSLRFTRIDRIRLARNGCPDYGLRRLAGFVWQSGTLRTAIPPAFPFADSIQGWIRWPPLS